MDVLNGSCGMAASVDTLRERNPLLAVAARRVGLQAVQGRKQPGSGFSISPSHRRAPLSQEQFCIELYKAPAREGIQALRAAAHPLARVANHRNPPISFLRRSSQLIAMLGF